MLFRIAGPRAHRWNLGVWIVSIPILLTAVPVSHATPKSATDAPADDFPFSISRTRMVAASNGKSDSKISEPTSTEKPAEKSPEKKASGVKVKVDDGLKIQSEDKAYSYSIAGRINVDSRSFSYPKGGLFGDVDPSKQLFDMRRVRLDVKATLATYYQIKLSEDYADGAELKEAFITYTFFKNADILVGQFQYPYSSEEVGSSKYFQFLEMSNACAALCNGEDRGIMLRGDPSDGRYHYEAGLFNGAGANTADNNNELDQAIRVVMNPADPDDDVKYWIGFSYNTGKQTTSVDADSPTELQLRTESRSKKKFFKAEFDLERPYTRTRQGLDATYLSGPTTVKAEYFRGDYKFAKTVSIQGAYLMAGYFLTGEQRSVKNGVFEKQKVDEPYEPDGDARGAYEVTARYSVFHADTQFFEADSVYTGWEALSASKYVNAGYSWTYGFNWYPDKMSRIQINYITAFTAKELIKSFNSAVGMSGKAAETAILVRMQQEF